MRELGHQIVDVLVDHFEHVQEQPVVQCESREQLESSLREPPPEHGSPPDQVLALLRSEVLSNIAHHDHPRFFAFVPSPSNFVSAMADALASGFNVFVGTWIGGSGPTEVELVAADWLRQICGLPEDAGGLFVASGSMANLTALAVARHVKLGDDIRDAVVYCSDQTHTSNLRGLHLLGFQHEQIREIPGDQDFLLPIDAVRTAIRQDREAGRKPFCVIANVGTTNTGAVDSLPDLATLCRKEDLWLHADGAYGAAAVLTARGKRLLEGLPDVDSLALDPHKWLFQPYEIGSVLVRDRTWMRDTFSVHADYLQDIQGPEINLADYGTQLTRNFRALKLWLSLKVFGLAAFRSAIDHGMDMAEYAESVLRRSETWEIVSPARLGIVTFRCRCFGVGASDTDVLNHYLVSGLDADGFAMISSTRLNGVTVLRLCTINPRTTRGDIDGTVSRLEQLAKQWDRKGKPAASTR